MGIALSGVYFLTRVLILSVLVFGAWLAFNNQLAPGELVAFVLYANLLLKPIDKISALMELYPKGMAGFKRFTEMIDQEPDINDKPDAIEVDSLHGNITFNDVTFGYNDTQKVLQELNFNIQSGQTVAFVGPSGAGKSTICSLIPRFYDVDKGTITIDGINIQDMTKNSLRNQIGIVQQDVFLFTGTIKENIAYGKLDATEEEIILAASKAHLTQWIDTLPDGFETQVGERGLKLSGGQKQRLAIARMFLKNPPILILDEATSALDTETEKLIQSALTELSKDRTTLVIAHRFATIKNADKIMVVTEDGITEEGTEEELLALEGIFANLHHVQYQ